MKATYTFTIVVKIDSELDKPVTREETFDLLEFSCRAGTNNVGDHQDVKMKVTEKQ